MKSLQKFEDSGLDEISLVDAFLFLKETYKTILIFGALGVALAIAFLVITPKRYEATAQIQMAQIIAANNSSSSNNNNLLGVNIEDPALLISRLALPASFTQKEAKACGLGNQQGVEAILAKSIKVSPIKGVGNVVELKAFGESPEAAANCAKAVFEMIKATQFQIVLPYIEEAIAKIADDQKRLTSAQQVIANADKSGQAMSASYLATRDEIRFLLDEVTSLRNIITSGVSRAAHLVSPIYADNTPIAPRKPLVLLVGLLGGLFVGALLALISKSLTKLESHMGGVL